MAYDDWSDEEVKMIIADYFSMLINEINGIKINKAYHRRLLLPRLNNRSESAIEFKHQNISAVLVEMGIPFIKGYIPLYNFQRAKLPLKVAEYIEKNFYLEKNFIEFSNDAPSLTTPIDFNSLKVEPPEKKKKDERIEITRNPTNINYLEREQNNRRIGLQGEELALNYERFLLISAGKEALSEKIEWVSKDLGDGLGFDILSKNLNGSDKYIEVKTTKLGKEAPFFFSYNEYNFSLKNSPNYHLYRVFDFSKTPKMFTLQGSFDSFCYVKPTQYRGKF